MGQSESGFDGVGESHESWLSRLEDRFSLGSCFSFTVSARYLLGDIADLVERFDFHVYMAKILVLVCIYSKHRRTALFPEHFVIRVVDFFGKDFGTIRKRESVHYLKSHRPQNVILVNVSRGTISDDDKGNAIRVTEARFDQELMRMGHRSERLKSYVQTYLKIARMDVDDDLTSVTLSSMHDPMDESLLSM